MQSMGNGVPFFCVGSGAELGVGPAFRMLISKMHVANVSHWPAYISGEAAPSGMARQVLQSFYLQKARGQGNNNCFTLDFGFPGS